MHNTLKAIFLYPNQRPQDFKALYTAQPRDRFAGASLLLADISVALAGKAVESLIDAVAAALQPEATTLDVTLPLEGFYDAQEAIAVDDAYLIFHNGSTETDHASATICGSFRVVVSDDRTAFRFEVAAWRFTELLNDHARWFESPSNRDFALKIEFLAPGASDLGTRAVFVEHVFRNLSAASLNGAFLIGQKLPWLATPVKSPGSATGVKAGGYCLPLNIRVTFVETTKPNQFATWVREIAQEKKADITTAVKNAVRGSLDESYSATESLKRGGEASAAYDAYIKAWQEAQELQAKEPKEPAVEIPIWRARLDAKKREVEAKRRVAHAAFRSAELNWPGDLRSL